MVAAVGHRRLRGGLSMSGPRADAGRVGSAGLVEGTGLQESDVCEGELKKTMLETRVGTLSPRSWNCIFQALVWTT